MAQFSVVERIIKKINDTIEPLGAPLRRKKLNNTDFTIISNNCWGGRCYEYFGLQKKTPTVGCYFFAEDYIKFVHDLQYYMNLEIKMIRAEESRHADELSKRKQLNIPVGVLGDLEIVFLHYKDPIIAKQTWERRVARVNWENLIIKFSYMNECTDKHVEEFSEHVKKYHAKSLVFLAKEMPSVHNGVVIPCLANGQIGNDTFYWKKYINIYKLINTGNIN